MFSAYRPCLPSGSGVNTVYAQHACHLGTSCKDPRSQLLIDLAEAIKACQEPGDIIILGMDINQDVTSRQIHQFFRELHLRNAITIHHPQSSPPATCHRNEHRVQIDGLYCSIDTVPVATGFLQFGEGTPSDHRAMWADFRKADIIGARAAVFRPAVIGLHALDPRDVHRYNTRSFARLTKAKVITDLTALSKVPPAEFTPKHQQEYNRLQQVNRDIRLEVRQSVRHVYRGAQQFSPESVNSGSAW
jgi:hypothetical protein